MKTIFAFLLMVATASAQQSELGRRLRELRNGDYDEVIKAQVAATPGIADHYRSQLHHALDQAQNARSPANRDAGLVSYCQTLAMLDGCGITLSDSGRKEGRDFCFASLKDKAVERRFAGLRALWFLADENDVPEIQKFLIVESDFENQCEAAGLLRKLGDVKSACGFFEQAATKKPREAIWTLADFGGDEAKATLLRLRKTLPLRESREQIDKALDKIEGHSTP